MTILLALRIHGPINRVTLAAKLDRLPDDVTDEIYDHLKPAGLVTYNPISGTWSVTERGRRLVDHHEVPEVGARARDEARECVGVRT